MAANSTQTSRRPYKLLYETLLSLVISAIVLGGAIGGFVIGRDTSRDAYVQKMGRLLADEGNIRTAYDLFEAKIDDPLTARALSKLYNVGAGDRAALIQRLRGIAGIPPYRRAPFVGHIARPYFSDDLRINMLGFRDDRQSYVTKPARTVRVFLTGGSTAWGSLNTLQANTISYLLEQMLNKQVSPATGYNYEVINTAFPAWSTTQEKILIQQRLVDLHPDVVLMLSGNNDVHWTVNKSDIRWFFSYPDQNYLLMLNELYASSGHPERAIGTPVSARPIVCSDLARVTSRNVEEAAFATGRVNARLIFALQPNVISTAKRLSEYEQALLKAYNKPFWDSCYQALRVGLGEVKAEKYQFLDLSRSFGEVDENTEIFADGYHFIDQGNRLIAEALVEKIDWRSIVPLPAVANEKEEPLKIVSFSPTAYDAGKPFNLQPNGMSVMMIAPNRVNSNLVAVFDRSVVTTYIHKDFIQALLPPSYYATKGAHTVHVVDSVSGETSPSVTFDSR